MDKKKISKVLALATASRGGLYWEKLEVFKNNASNASERLTGSMQLVFDCILLLKVSGKLSAYRINQYLNTNQSIYLRVFKQYGLIDEHQDEQTKVKYYTLTPLSTKMIDDLLMMYDEKINTYLKLNAKDKRTKPAKLLANSKNKAKK